MIWAASYGYRYNDPLGTFYAADEHRVTLEVEAAIDHELAERPGYCEQEHSNDNPIEHCSLCNPDIVEYGAFQVLSVDELGGFTKALEIAREIRKTGSAVADPV